MEKIKLNYISDDYTKVDFSFSNRIISIVKSCGYAKWFDSGNIKYWYIPRSKTLNMIQLIKEKRIPLELEKTIQIEFNLSRMAKTQEEIDQIALRKLNDPSYAISSDYDTNYLNFREGFDLYPYQKAGLKYSVIRNGRVLFGDDMGLGKTPQGIAMARHYKNDWPLVVIAPASLLFNWKKEIMLWLPDIKDEDIKIIKNGKEKPSRKITIASYDYTIKQEDSIKNYLGVRGVLLIDEAHNMKNSEAKRTQSLMRICHVVKRLAIITGTPFLSRPKEAWTLLNSIDPFEKEWKDQLEFEAKYCEASIMKIGYKNIYQANGAANIEEFHDTIRKKVMVRRLKTDEGVLDQLPPKRRLTQYLEIDGDYKDSVENLTLSIAYRVIKQYRIFGGNDLRKLKKEVLSDAEGGGVNDDLFKAYKLTGMAKVDVICEWLSSKLDDSNSKFIVFGHHKDFLTAISNILEKKKIKYMKIEGSTKAETRFENTEKFQKDPECRVAVLSILAASVGLTLTAAKEVIMGEFPWTPALAQQAECRAHRNGQKETVSCYYMIANNTIDGYLWNMLSRKSQTSSLMLDGGQGDEMEEQIDMETADILDAIIIQIHDNVSKGILDLSTLPEEFAINGDDDNLTKERKELNSELLSIIQGN